MFLYDGAARLTGIPDIALHPPQAKQLAEEMVNLGKFYNVRLSPKAQALWSFAIVFGTINLPRGRLLIQRTRQRQAEVRQRAQAAKRPPAGPIGETAPAQAPAATEAASPAPAADLVLPVVGGRTPPGFDNVSSAGPGVLDLTGGSFDPGKVVTVGNGKAPPVVVTGAPAGKLDLTGAGMTRFLARR